MSGASGVIGKAVRIASGYGKVILFSSVIFVLVSAAPVVDTGTLSFPGRTVSDYITPTALASPEIKTITGRVKRGETASSLLNSYMPLSTIYDLDTRSKEIFPLTALRKGQPYKIRILDDSLLAFEYEIDDQDRLLIHKDEDSYAISKVPIEYKVRQEVVSVDIQSCLAEAVANAGEGTDLTFKLADIFAWDIDFAKDIQPGDRFKALVEKRYREGRFAGYGDVKAAFFNNQGTTYKAFLHEDAKGVKSYYDEKGASLEKAFLKAPLNFSKISSSFSANRFHPILKTFRAHLGVDYAAPKNTPIKAVADGVVKSVSYSDTTGKQVTIRHTNGYETAYFHMNKYASSMKTGKPVNQGDTIGYVGKTGLATGYHLCFRMRKDGRPVNPLKQASLRAKPVARSEMRKFKLLAGQYTEKIQANQKLARSGS